MLRAPNRSTSTAPTLSFTDNGSILQLSKGLYALIPEGRRGPDTAWIPTIEGAAIGMAAALYGPDKVALIDPSAARAHRCYPRALGAAYVTAQARLRPRESAVGNIRFVTREFDKMDTVRVETDLGPGWASLDGCDKGRARFARGLGELATRLETKYSSCSPLVSTGSS